LELAGNAARDNKKQRIVPRHLQIATRNAAVLEYLFTSLLFSNTSLLKSGSRLAMPLVITRSNVLFLVIFN